MAVNIPHITTTGSITSARIFQRLRAILANSHRQSLSNVKKMKIYVFLFSKDTSVEVKPAEEFVRKHVSQAKLFIYRIISRSG